jgi:hypothetical protein
LAKRLIIFGGERQRPRDVPELLLGRYSDHVFRLEKSLALLQAASLPPPDVLARSLINELDQIHQPFILVLDDYHSIQNTDVHHLLTELFRYAPRSLHTVMASRSDPPLSLTTLRANGQATKLRASDAENYDCFGRSVAISGDTVIVGAYGEDGTGSDLGAAYVYGWKPLTEITVSLGSLAFGDRDVDAGPSPSQMVSITNDGGGDLYISSVSLTGANAVEFAIESDSGEATLASGEMRTVQVSFDPSCEGAKSASLSIASNDGDEPTVKVTLSGNGVPRSSGRYPYLPLVLNSN